LQSILTCMHISLSLISCVYFVVCVVRHRTSWLSLMIFEFATPLCRVTTTVGHARITWPESYSRGLESIYGPWEYLKIPNIRILMTALLKKTKVLSIWLMNHSVICICYSSKLENKIINLICTRKKNNYNNILVK